MNWKYCPICIQIVPKIDNEATLDPQGYSGIYIESLAADSQHYFFTIGNSSISNQDFNGYISSASLVDKTNIEWFPASLKLQLGILSQNASDKLSRTIKFFLETGFKLSPIQTKEMSESETISNTSLLIFDIKSAANYKQFRYKVSKSLQNLSFDSIQSPTFSIRSSPFNLTNPALFMDFVSVGQINFTISDDSEIFGYFSDVKYLENMIGGVVLNKDNQSKSLGLVVGSIRKLNGDGELTLIVSWQRIFKILKPIINNFLLNSLHSTLSYPKKAISIDSVSTNNVIAITVADEFNYNLYWGSGIILNQDTIVTNRHVVENNAKTIIRIYLDSENSFALKLQGLRAVTSIKYDYHMEDYDQLISPSTTLDLAYIKLSSSHKKLIKKYVSSNLESTYDYAMGDYVESIGFGLFLSTSVNQKGHTKELQPLKSSGCINKLWEYPLFEDSTYASPCIMITSSSCWNGSSGGGLFRNNKFIGLICSNAQVKLPEVFGVLDGTEKVSSFSLCIPAQILFELYDYIMSDSNRKINPKISQLWGLDKTHNDVYIDLNKL